MRTLSHLHLATFRHSTNTVRIFHLAVAGLRRDLAEACECRMKVGYARDRNNRPSTRRLPDSARKSEKEIKRSLQARGLEASGAAHYW